MIRRPPRSTLDRSSAASDVYKRQTWKKLDGGGLPEGLLGRIGIDVSRSNPNVVYAQMEVGASVGTGGEEQTFGGQAAASPSPSPSGSASPTAAATPVALPTPTPL